MLNIDKLFKPLEIAASKQSTSSTNSVPASDTESTSQGSFEALLAKILPPAAQDTLNEEEVFAGVVKERLQKISPEAATSYETLLQQNLLGGFSMNGQFNYEVAAGDSLNQLVEKKLLTKDQANTAYSQSFQVAQLDNNQGMLSGAFAASSEENSPVLARGTALERAYEKLIALDQGSLSAPVRELAAASPYLLAMQLSNAVKQTTPKTPAAEEPVVEEKPVEPKVEIDTKSDRVLTASQRKFKTDPGFVFQPIHSGDGKLRIQLPKGFDGKISEITINDVDGKMIEKGNLTKSKDALRDQYAFSQPGTGYAANLTVKAQFSDGGSVSYKVRDPRKRHSS